jgi:hypothetical protein
MTLGLPEFHLNFTLMLWAQAHMQHLGCNCAWSKTRPNGTHFAPLVTFWAQCSIVPCLYILMEVIGTPSKETVVVWRGKGCHM